MTRSAPPWLSTIGRSAARMMSEHAGLVFLALTSIGACYEFFLYLQFRVNIFQFAEPLDFLFAAIRQPLVVLFTVLPLAFLAIVVALDRGLKRLMPAYGRISARYEAHSSYVPARNLSYAMFVPIYFLLFTLLYAKQVANDLRSGKGRQVAVDLVQQVDGVSRRLDGTLIGTTARFVFVFVAADTSTHAIPIGGIADMTLRRHARSASSSGLR